MMNDLYNDKYAPGYGLDPLSEVLKLLKLDVMIYHNAKVCGSWQMEKLQRPGCSFHIVTLGGCLLNAPGHFSGALHEGDLMIFPAELPHSLHPLEPLDGAQCHLTFSDGEGQPGTGLLCGEVNFQHRGSQHLLGALPPLLIIRYEQAAAWMKPLLAMLVAENRAPGFASKVIFDRLCELLFIYALRQYMADQENRDSQVGMLALYANERLAAAVKLIHQQPAEAWSLDHLAGVAMISRTVFAEKFKAASGWTVGQYITWWRMQLAWQQLQQGDAVSAVSDRVGYRSEAAFSRAFKKMFDVPPGRVRRGEVEDRR